MNGLREAAGPERRVLVVSTPALQHMMPLVHAVPSSLSIHVRLRHECDIDAAIATWMSHSCRLKGIVTSAGGVHGAGGVVGRGMRVRTVRVAAARAASSAG